MGKFVTDIKKIREQARKHMLEGAVTENYKADREDVVAVLNDVLATEMVCVLRYKRHYYTAQGLNAEPARDQFQEHAKEEEEHADWVAERISQLDGKPDYNPSGIANRSHSEYDESESLLDMLREDLVAERIAIDSYAQIVRWLADRDPTTRILMEKILKVEEEHADDLKDLLAKSSG